MCWKASKHRHWKLSLPKDCSVLLYRFTDKLIWPHTTPKHGMHKPIMHIWIRVTVGEYRGKCVQLWRDSWCCRQLSNTGKDGADGVVLPKSCSGRKILKVLQFCHMQLSSC
ncbi:uncharacterized protein LOC115960033 [Quercus lobata]|uniref:uncharacterized protein LOC115960033 n=1 Tax=Quercus lobata TaxID=97700 RepID=UPI00124477A9|nr:uncharacterized protein LOC115960033 [Quercus lobata]XP_030934590.1 uncharacterized protein LOC115960033 [Quercus lobata]XP_030934591.1 uncharacterized protein LOC115960033 [Quercus lobata]